MPSIILPQRHLLITKAGYINTWLERIPQFSKEEDVTEEETDPADLVVFDNDTGALDIMDTTSHRRSGSDPFDGDTSDDEDAESNESSSGSSSDEEAIVSSEPEQSKDSRIPSKAPVQQRTRRASSRLHRNFRTVMYIQMEYCEKRTLQDLIRRDLFKDTNEAWRLLRQILEGLVYMHSMNVMHRDLKPANIFIDSASNVVRF